MNDVLFNKLKQVLKEEMREDVFQKETLPLIKRNRQEIYRDYQTLLKEKRIKERLERLERG